MDLQRTVREMTNDLAKKRGRPFYQAARVSGTLETCCHIGYDFPTWVNEGLIDLLISAGGAATDPSLDVTVLVELCRNKEIGIYPGPDSTEVFRDNSWGRKIPTPKTSCERTRLLADITRQVQTACMFLTGMKTMIPGRHCSHRLAQPRP